MMVYGPGQWDVAKLLPYVITTLLSGRSPAVSSGTREMDWVFVDDVIDGLLSVAQSAVADADMVDLGSGTLTSIRDIVQQVAQVIGADVPIQFGAVPDRPLERPRAARADRTRAATGWSAATPLDEGLKRTVRWYQEEWSLPKPA
jgi:nucleoside-diphosphate-sugar epimerase